jgi:uncharacterized protein (TIGR02217 family)
MFLFHDIRFPENVSWGARGGPAFKTQIFESLQGYEKRNIEWAQPQMRFNVAYGIRTDIDMEIVLRFFTARQGMAHGFRYKNWSNYKVAPGATIAVADGVSTRLNIYKVYGPATNLMYKRLFKIVVGTVTGVKVNAVPVVEGVDFTIDYNSGEMIFTTVHASGFAVTVDTLEFDEPVRFDMDNIQSISDAWNSNSLSQVPLIGFRGVFTSGTAFSPGGTPSGTDSFFPFTTMLFGFDDTDGAVTTTDFSTLGQTVTFNGDAAITRSEFKYGLGSLSVGTGNITVPGAAMQLGKKPMTIELFARKPLTGANMQPMVSQWNETTDERGWTLRYNKVTEHIQFAISPDGVNEIILTSYPWDTVDPSFYNYITLDRLLNGWYVFRIDGEVFQTFRNQVPIFDSAAVVSVGGYEDTPAGVGSFQELIDSVRMTTGRVRHDTFEAITTPLPYAVA